MAALIFGQRLTARRAGRNRVQLEQITEATDETLGQPS
jgi:hypothetical protein